MSSITAVAKAAGVSIATVSRVINHLPQVAPETAALVQKAMDELGYHPTPLEQRRPKDGPKNPWPTGVKKGTIALLFPDSRDAALRTALSGRFMHGLNDVLSPLGMSMLTTPLQADGSLPAMIAKSGVDGLVVRASVPVEAIARLAPPMPIVWLLELAETNLTRGDQVQEDTAAIGRLAAQHLLNRGHRVLATINSDPFHPCYSRRVAAFASETLAAGAQVVTIDGGRLVAPAEVPALTSRLAPGPGQPTGLFIPTNDEGVVAVHRSLVGHGITPGKDLDLVTCGNDRHLLSALDPSLVNVDIHAEAMAQAAGELLLWRLANPTARRRRVLIEPSIGPVVEG